MRRLTAAAHPGEAGVDVAEEGVVYTPGNLDLMRALNQAGRRVY